MSLYPSIRIEGGLLGPELFEQLLNADLPGQKPADFGIRERRSLTDEIAAVFADARALWSVFQNRRDRLPENDPATTVTRDTWMVPFFGLLGYELQYNPRAHEIDGLSFAISHRAGRADDSPRFTSSVPGRTSDAFHRPDDRGWRRIPCSRSTSTAASNCGASSPTA